MSKTTTRKEEEQEEKEEGGQKGGEGEEEMKGALSLEPAWTVTGPAVVLRRLCRGASGGRSRWRGATETVERGRNMGEGEMISAQRGLRWRRQWWEVLGGVREGR